MPPAKVSVEQRENWLSLFYHVSNIHSWDNTTIFKKSVNKKLPSISRSTEFRGESKFLCKVLCFVLLLLKQKILHLYSLTYSLSCLNWSKNNLFWTTFPSALKSRHWFIGENHIKKLTVLVYNFQKCLSICEGKIC